MMFVSAGTSDYELKQQLKFLFYDASVSDKKRKLLGSKRRDSRRKSMKNKSLNCWQNGSVSFDQTM